MCTGTAKRPPTSIQVWYPYKLVEIVIHREYVTNALFRYRYITMNEGREVGEILVVKLM